MVFKVLLLGAFMHTTAHIWRSEDNFVESVSLPSSLHQFWGPNSCQACTANISISKPSCKPLGIILRLLYEYGSRVVKL